MPVSSAFFNSYLAQEPLGSQIRNLWTMHELPADYEVSIEHLPQLEIFGNDVTTLSLDRSLATFYIKLLLALANVTRGKENKCKIINTIYSFILRGAGDLMSESSLVKTMTKKLEDMMAEKDIIPESQHQWKIWHEYLTYHYQKNWPELEELYTELRSAMIDNFVEYLSNMYNQVAVPILSYDALPCHQEFMHEAPTRHDFDQRPKSWNAGPHGYITLQRGFLNGPFDYNSCYGPMSGSFINGKPDGTWKHTGCTCEFKDGRMISWTNGLTSVTIVWNEDGTINHRKCTKTGLYGSVSSIPFEKEVRLYQIVYSFNDDGESGEPVLVTYRVPVDAERVAFFIRETSFAVSKATVESIKSRNGETVRKAGHLTFQDEVVDKDFSTRFTKSLFNTDEMISGYLTINEAISAYEND